MMRHKTKTQSPIVKSQAYLLSSINWENSLVKKIAFYFLLLAIGLMSTGFRLFSQQEVPVFTAGEEGHKSYRIPAIVAMPDGKLLAFAEGRVDNAGDFGNINIVLKTSSDQGATWSALQTVAGEGESQIGNPAPVVDNSDPRYPQGRIFLFYNTGNNHEYDVRAGKGFREVWYKTSIDGGKSWSSAVNITTQVHRPNFPSANSAYNFKEDWRSYANTPGHAMQFKAGKYKGRIYVAANHSEGSPKNDFSDYLAHGYYTDDHGNTFHISENVDLPGGNENSAAELSGGRLMLNLRNQRGHVRARYVAISNDGGKNWSKSYFDKNLPDPVCEGSILTIGKHKKKNILAFCNAADTAQRNNLTLRISMDDGKTWTKSFVIYKGEGKGDFSAYSDIVKIDDKTIGVYYEKDNYSKMVFTKIKWK